MDVESLSMPAHVRLGRALRAAADLLVLIALTLALPSIVTAPFPVLRLLLSLVLVLFAPGYVLIAALFPQPQQLDHLSRIALSIGCSIAVIPLLALALDQLPWGLQLWPMVVSLELWLLALAMIALLRRWKALPAVLPVAVPATAASTWGGAAIVVLVGGIVAGAVLAVDAIPWTNLAPPGDLTEFYVLGSTGRAEEYPYVVTAGVPMQVSVGVRNRSGVPDQYRIHVRSGDELLAQAGPYIVAPGAVLEVPLHYALARVGDDQQVDIVLFRGDEPQPYRRLQLWVTSTPP